MELSVRFLSYQDGSAMFHPTTLEQMQTILKKQNILQSKAEENPIERFIPATSRNNHFKGYKDWRMVRLSANQFKAFRTNKSLYIRDGIKLPLTKRRMESLSMLTNYKMKIRIKLNCFKKIYIVKIYIDEIRC